MTPDHVRLDQFDPNIGFKLKRSKYIFVLWYFIKIFFFLSPLPWPYFLKVFLLRAFGSRIGLGLVLKPRVNIHFPWNLVIGDYVWIGEEVSILNFSNVSLGSHVCLSQQVFLCTGNHDFRDPSFSYKNQPITLESGVWLQARVFVSPGTVIGSQSVVTSSSMVKGIHNGNLILSGNPAAAVSERWRSI